MCCGVQFDLFVLCICFSGILICFSGILICCYKMNCECAIFSRWILFEKKKKRVYAFCDNEDLSSHRV